MKWEILILTQPNRAPWLAECLLRLLPQVNWPDVMVTIQTHDDNQSLGNNRQRMLCASRGDYVNFVDDDDLVTEDYAASIYPLLGTADVVTFPMEIHDPRIPVQLFQPLDLTEVKRDWGWCRDILHLSPLRRDIALSFPMEGGRQEDVRWAKNIRSAKLIKTQVLIEHALYLYYPGATRTIPIPEPIDRSKGFWWHQGEVINV